MQKIWWMGIKTSAKRVLNSQVITQTGRKQRQNIQLCQQQFRFRRNLVIINHDLHLIAITATGSKNKITFRWQLTVAHPTTHIAMGIKKTEASQLTMAIVKHPSCRNRKEKC